MAQTTGTDTRELKTAIDSNTRAIASQSERIESIIRATEANTKAIADLTLEIRLGFSNVENRFTKIEGRIDNLETKLEGQINNLDTKLTGKIDALGEKFEERTKGFGQRLDGKELAQRNIFTGLTVVIVGGLLLTIAKYLFFGTTLIK